MYGSDLISKKTLRECDTKKLMEVLQMKKKQNYFLLGLSVFLLGGTLLFSSPTEVEARGTVTCSNVVSGTICQVMSPESRQDPSNPSGNWQVRGRVSGIRGNNGTITAQVTQFTIGNRSTGSGTRVSASNAVIAVSPWIADLNDTGTTNTTGTVTTP